MDMAEVSIVTVNGCDYAFKDAEARAALGTISEQIETLMGDVSDAIVERGGTRPGSLAEMADAIRGIPA